MDLDKRPFILRRLRDAYTPNPRWRDEQAAEEVLPPPITSDDDANAQMPSTRFSMVDLETTDDE